MYFYGDLPNLCALAKKYKSLGYQLDKFIEQQVIEIGWNLKKKRFQNPMAMNYYDMLIEMLHKVVLELSYDHEHIDLSIYKPFDYLASVDIDAFMAYNVGTQAFDLENVKKPIVFKEKAETIEYIKQH